ncbi:MAG: EAL domain-containing protein [Acidaminococcaceae bacterium]
MPKTSTPELLCNYLRDLIADPLQVNLDMTALPSAWQPFGERLLVLTHYLQEEKILCTALAAGKIRNLQLPHSDNPLAAPLKNIHDTILALINLLEQVADGDYNRRLHSKNELSEAFNAMVERLISLVMIDGLTGLLTEQGFDEKAKKILAHTDKQYYLIAINVNDFKRYNALYGLKKSNALLKDIATQVQSICRENELCARIHADNFIALVYASNLQEVLDKVIANSKQLQVGLTFRTNLFRHGIYCIVDKNRTLREMRDCANLAMERINNIAETNIAIYDNRLHQQRQWENHILANFNEALISKEFILNYQPKFNLHTNKIDSAEALIRWFRPGGEIKPPEAFIRLFETNGLITSLDFYVVEMVCIELRSRLDQGLPIVPIAVNFSRIHLYDPFFVQKLKTILSKHQINPCLIEVELTETAIFESMDAMATALQQLHTEGFIVAMDDFGSGFSSLNILKNLQLDTLKIDRLFFNSFEKDPRVGELLTDIFSIAKHLNLKTVAEGVETKAQFDFLTTTACDYIQGYYCSRPLPTPDFFALLSAQA